MTFRTRFAPSPTGYLHIGGVRTALFNWLFTRRHGGQFILRIDDTDVGRNKPEALQPILDGFKWLGITWDEGPDVGGPHAPYYQSQRNDLYVEAAMKLLNSGHAYPDYTTPEELEAKRKAVKGNYIHRGVNRDNTPVQNISLYAEKPTVLRFKVPTGRSVVVKDLICGDVEQKTDLLGDPVILRPDKTPLYNFATVIDDAAMEITHVIRAREHLSNTPAQILFFEALGHALPQFAHVPVVNEPNSKKKLSKRDMKKFVTPEVRAKLHAVGWSDEEIDSRDDLNPATVAFYRELGYLPAGLVNYLGRLGWSLDDKSEFIPLDQMIAHFSLERVNDSPASFDPDKLYWLAGEYMRLLPLDEKVHGVIPFLRRARLVGDPVGESDRQKIEKVVVACGDRLKLFSDILLYGAPFFRPDPAYDARALEKRLKPADAQALLRGFRDVLATAEPYENTHLEELLRKFCEEKGAKAGTLIHALRISTTGMEVGPSVFDCLTILGREETLRRIDLGLARVSA
jgi:nondiscriminating glutamyl-tRNA synthetase